MTEELRLRLVRSVPTPLVVGREILGGGFKQKPESNQPYFDWRHSFSCREGRRFESDGNPNGPAMPSFDCICAVILEIGREGNDRPDGIGTAIVDVGPMILLDDVSDYDRARARITGSSDAGQGLDVRFDEVKR